jgi:hypothetical protein
MASVSREPTSTSVIAQRATAARTATKIWDRRAKSCHAETAHRARKIASETTNVYAQMNSPVDSARRLSSRIHCARRIRVLITERVGFHLKAKPMNVNVWKASPATIAKSTSTIVHLSHVRTVAFALMKLLDFRVTAAELATLESFARKTSTNVREIRVRTTACASTTTAVTRASVDRDSVAITASKSSTNVNPHLVSTAAIASRREKVTLSAFVAMVFRDSFVKLHPNAPITVPMIRNVWMVGVFASKA